LARGGVPEPEPDLDQHTSDDPLADAAALTRRRSAESRLALSAVAALSLLLLAAGYVVGDETLRLIGVFGALIAGVGAAPLQLSDQPGFVTRVGVAVMFGLATATLVGSVMVLGPLWHPFIAALLIGLAAARAHMIGVQSALRDLRETMPDRRRRAPVPRTLVQRAASSSLSSKCTVAGTVLWFATAVGEGHLVPGIGGFLPHISPLWYAGVVLLIVAIALAGRQSEPHVAIPVLLLIAALTITPALIYGEPRSQTAIKHVVLVQHILAPPHHLRTLDSIYYTYSGFFSAMAWLCRVAGVGNPLGLATFWPALIGVAGAAELRFLFGRLISSGYRCWIGVTIAVLVNAVGQDYFSPQSVGYVIALGVFALVIVGAATPAVTPRTQLALLLVAGCSLAVTHELSPYIAGGVLVTLAAFRLVRPWWAAAMTLVPAAAWAALNAPVLSGFISLSALGNLSNFRPPTTPSAPGLSRLAIVGTSSHALLLGLLILVGLSLIGLARNARRASAWGFMMAAGLGLVFISINPYGSEGIFRAALFAIPWLSIVGLASVRKPPWRWAGFGVVGVVLLALFLVAQFGLDQSNVARSSDIRALHAFIAQAPRGSYRLELGDGDLPLTLDPALHILVWDPLWNPRNKTELAVHSVSPPTTGDLNVLTEKYIEYAKKIGHTPARNLFVVWAPVVADYAVEYAVETMANARAWRDLFLASPRWKVVFAADGSYLFRYRPAA
jgi:hypothetical protein